MKTTPRSSKRDALRRRESTRKILTYGGLGLLALGALAVIVASGGNAPLSPGLMGTAVPINSAQHVAEGTPISYNSNPPAGGMHYATSWQATFFQESDLASLPANPEGYLVHSLEHGYVIFWYNCALSPDCEGLKQTIQQVMDETGGTKLIAFPWVELDVPLAMTSWGQVLRFDEPDAEQMKEFVLRNRYKAPEPNAD